MDGADETLPGDAGMTIDVLLPSGPRASAIARRVVRRALADQVAGEVIDDALLVASELVSNSVVHAGLTAEQRIQLRVVVGPGLLIVVRDRGRGFARSLSTGGRPTRMTGFGLVAALSDRWGYRERQGIQVWAELAL